MTDFAGAGQHRQPARDDDPRVRREDHARRWGAPARSSSSRCRRTTRRSASRTSPRPAPSSAGSPRCRSPRGWRRTIDYFRGVLAAGVSADRSADRIDPMQMAWPPSTAPAAAVRKRRPSPAAPPRSQGRRDPRTDLRRLLGRVAEDGGDGDQRAAAQLHGARRPGDPHPPHAGVPLPGCQARLRPGILKAARLSVPRPLLLRFLVLVARRRHAASPCCAGRRSPST